jgi:Domain of unknown function (DUF6468)
MSPIITVVADLLVAVLLTATIVTSMRLSQRITRLKADEAAMRQTIGELMLSTETAERAIAGLRTTLGDCDRTLAERLRTAERYAADLSEQVEAGNAVMNRIAQIVESTRKVAALRPEPPQAANEPANGPAKSPNGERLSAAAAAAKALTERAARRLGGAAA